jgi:hypothetical protein
MGIHGLLSYLKERNAYNRINLIEKAQTDRLSLVVDANAFIIKLKIKNQVSKTSKENDFAFVF